MVSEASQRRMDTRDSLDDRQPAAAVNHGTYPDVGLPATWSGYRAGVVSWQNGIGLCTEGRFSVRVIQPVLRVGANRPDLPEPLWTGARRDAAPVRDAARSSDRNAELVQQMRVMG